MVRFFYQSNLRALLAIYRTANLTFSGVTWRGWGFGIIRWTVEKKDA